tara:strand:+ start:75 stop:1220 length:1146 start_codon:yes stop_codon:yes gene_type:complete
MRKYLLLHVLIISFVFLLTPTVQAEGTLKGKKNSFFSEIRENLLFKKEVILGGSWSDEKNQITGRNSIGFEILKKISDRKGDWGSVLLQMRLVRYDHQFMLMNNNKMLPNHIDDMHDWELEFHDAYFKYSGRFKGRFNLRIGHFDVPYGLEQNVDTHSTLMQLMSTRNVGFKKDWGLSVGGQLPEIDYEFAFTRGSGIEYIDHGENFLLSGRIGTPADENFSIGISGLYGEPIDSMGIMRGKKMAMMGKPNTWFGRFDIPDDDIIRRWRIGLDSICLYGPFTFKGEISYGEDINQDVINGVLEIDYFLPGTKERLETILQVQGAYQDITASGSDNDTFSTLGMNYKITNEVTFRFTYRHDFERLKDTKDEDIIAVQLYCFF